MSDIIIDRELLKAIGADTRINILKALSERKKMLSELAKELKISKPTVLEHLKQLEDVELIKRIDGGRKWKYYELTEKGINLIQKRNIPIRAFIMLSMSIISLLSSIFLFQALSTNTQQVGGEYAFTLPLKSAESLPIAPQEMIFIAIFMFILGIVLFVFSKAEFDRSKCF